jgi:hypothetical protein
MRKIVVGTLLTVLAVLAGWLIAFAVPADSTPAINAPAPADVVGSRGGVIFETHDGDAANTMLPADQAIESAVGQVRPREQPDAANSDRQFN